jgi:NodT family efflux transporter outer membrane factor (OMF) lipoprotein
MDTLSAMLTNIKIISRTLLMASLCFSSFSGCINKHLAPLNLKDVNTSKSWKYLDHNFTSNDHNTTFWIQSFNIDNLNDAVHYAWNNNPDLLSLAEQTIARGEEAVMNGSNLLPDINLGVNGARSKRNLIGFNLPNGSTSFTSDSFNSGLNLSWEIDLWGKIKDRKLSSDKKFKIAKSEYYGARLSLAGEVARSWFTVVEAINQYELSIKTTSTFEKNHKYLSNRFANGLVSTLEKDLALNALSSAQANQTMRKRLLNQSLRNYELLLGQNSGSINESNFTSILPNLKFTQTPPTPSQTLETRPDLISARYRLEAAGYDQLISEKSLLPSISINGNSGSRTEEFSDLLNSNFRTWELSGSISQPIFNNGRLRANIRRSKALRKAALANYHSTALRAFAEVESLLANESFLKTEESYLSNATNAAKSAAEASWNRYQNGVIGIFDTLESQRQAFQAESKLLNLRKQRIFNRIQLFLALGSPALPKQ